MGIQPGFTISYAGSAGEGAGAGANAAGADCTV